MFIYLKLKVILVGAILQTTFLNYFFLNEKLRILQ